jgi:hypothetical protein
MPGMRVRKSAYARHRQRLMAAASTDIKKWEFMEKQLGRALGVDELKRHIGYVNSKGQYVEPTGSSL